MPNPYLTVIAELAEKLVAHDPERLARSFQKDVYSHWDADNEWIYPAMAGFLFTTVFAVTQSKCEMCKPDQAQPYIVALFDRLAEAAVDERWYHLQDRKGDPNIDRFTMVPFLEAFLAFKDELRSEAKAKILSKINGILRVQRAEYGDCKKENNPYPNMDVYYCLMMLLGFKITGENLYQAEFMRFLRLLEDAQFEEGAWTYINGTNECPVYHDINAALCARIWDLSKDERALNMIRRSTPYYPQIISTAGVPEYYTDPWWKHSWSKQTPMVPDIVSSITADQQNRFLGNRLRNDFLASMQRSLEKGMTNSLPPAIVYAAMYWRELPEAEIPTNVMYYDKNIEGPRGRFKHWQWAATAKYGSDTVVGALVNGNSSDTQSFLSGITAEIDYHPDQVAKGTLARFSLGMTPPGTRGITKVSGDFCTFDVSYQMACFRSIWDAAPFPFDWQCRQSWKLGETSLAGKIEVISGKEQESPPPLVRIRWGRNAELCRTGENCYRYGSFELRIGPNDFPSQVIKSAPVCCYLKVKDGAELILELDSKPASYRSAEKFSLQLEIITL